MAATHLARVREGSLKESGRKWKRQPLKINIPPKMLAVLCVCVSFWWHQSLWLHLSGRMHAHVCSLHWFIQWPFHQILHLHQFSSSPCFNQRSTLWPPQAAEGSTQNKSPPSLSPPPLYDNDVHSLSDALAHGPTVSHRDCALQCWNTCGSK